MSDTGIIITALEEIKGYGEVSVQDVNIEVDFNLQILKNGKGIGTILPKSILQNTFNHLGQNHFSLCGQVANTGDRLIACDCRMTNFSEMEGKFAFHSLKIFREAPETKPKNELYFHARVLNLYQTRNVSVQTSIGKLLIGHYKGIEQSENMMRLYDIPLITSVLQLSVVPNEDESIQTIYLKGRSIIEAFLKISSLYQMVWHDWVSIGIYERYTEKLLYFEFSSPKGKTPISMPLGDRHYANEFINAAWNGYSKDHEIKHNFDSALEWLIESNKSDLFATQYLCATTCLEMLMDKFHTQNKTEYLLDDDTFSALYKVLKDAASTFLESRGVDSKIQQSIGNALQGCKRRAYVEKFRMLIGHWNVSIDDIGIKFHAIKTIRDKITHEGSYDIRCEEQLREAERVYKGLMSILVKVFLAMLNFKKGYHDPWQNRWISRPFQE